MWPNPQFPANSVTFTEEIFNGKVMEIWNELLMNFVSSNPAIKYLCKVFFIKTLDQCRVMYWMFCLLCSKLINPPGICLFKVNDGNTRTMCKICSKVTIKAPERRQWRHSAVFTVKFEQISHTVLVFP